MAANISITSSLLAQFSQGERAMADPTGKEKLLCTAAERLVGADGLEPPTLSV